MKKILLLLVVTLCCTSVASAQWDLAADIQFGANPSGEWDYGWIDNGTGVFTSYNGTLGANFGGGKEFTAWVKDGGWDSHGNVGQSMGTADIDGDWGSVRELGQVIYGPQHPNVPPHRKTTSRWTAPAAGDYDITAVFTGQGLGGSHSNVSVALNGVDEWNTLVNGFVGRSWEGYTDGFGPDPLQAYGDTLTLAAGDTLDFGVVTGAQPAPIGVDVQIVPEPMTLILLGLGGLASIRRRRA